MLITSGRLYEPEKRLFPVPPTQVSHSPSREELPVKDISSSTVIVHGDSVDQPNLHPSLVPPSEQFAAFDSVPSVGNARLDDPKATLVTNSLRDDLSEMRHLLSPQAEKIEPVRYSKSPRESPNSGRKDFTLSRTANRSASDRKLQPREMHSPTATPPGLGSETSPRF